MPDLTISPYYDTTSEERQKGYQRFLGVPERYIQGRDLTVIQHMVQQQLRDIADTLYKNGAIIEGCQLLLNGTNVTITAGKVYYNGFVVPTEETSLTITGTGEEIVGVRITESIITENEDPSLRGPVPGSEAYGQPGMHRLKIDAEIVYGNDVQLPLFKFIDGSPLTVPIDPAMTELYNILARRTYDESENYLVNGLEVFATPSNDNSTVELTIESGKCYVEGFEIIKPYPTKMVRDKCTDTNSNIDNYHTVASGVTTYTFGKQPLSSVIYIKGNVMVEGATFYRTANPYDDLGLDNLITIHSVYLSNPADPYVLGSDYTKNGDQITWLVGGPHTPPSVGQAYHVTYTDKQALEYNVDYTIVQSSGLDAFQLQNTGRVQDLVEGSQLEVYYNYYLGRKDIVYIDKDGRILIVEGTPGDIDHVAAPLVPDRVLARAEVYMPPNSANAVVTNYFVRRLSMPDLHKIVKRLENLEYNIALKDMDNPSLYRVSAHQVTNMFTEGFIGFSKANTSHTSWSFGIDTSANVGMCPYSNIAYQDFDIDVATATKKGIGYMMPYSHESYISQMLASGSHNINPYSVFGRVALINIEPPVRYFTENLVVQEGTEDTNIVKNYLIVKNITTSIRRPRTETNTTTESEITSSWFEDRLLRSEAIEYIPETILEVTGTNFYPNQDNLRIYFDGVPLDATPLDGTPNGTTAGTVKSKSDGTLKLQFTIPANKFRTGVRKVELKNSYQEANVAFTANGIRNLYEKINRRIITTNNYTTTINYIQPTPREPLAQTFYNAENCYITKIDLYFKKKDTANIPVFVQLRNVVNGYPGGTILGHKLIYPSSIYTSNDGDTATTVEFDTPIFIEAGQEYCFVIGSDSNNYEIFIAEMGQTDILSGAPITRQPYFQGTMFSSANASAWTAHQMSDIKFKIYRARFNTNQVYILSTNETVNHTHFMAGVESIIPDGTSVTWYYSNNNGTTWIPFNPLDLICVANRSTTLKLKAVLDSSNRYLSPMVYPAIQAIFFDQAGTGTYISKLVSVPDTFNMLKCYLDVYIPLSTGQTVTLSISTDSGSTWTALTPDSSTAMSYGWIRRYYEESFSPAKNNIMFKITISTSNRSGRVQPAVANLIGLMLTV